MGSVKGVSTEPNVAVANGEAAANNVKTEATKPGVGCCESTWSCAKKTANTVNDYTFKCFWNNAKKTVSWIGGALKTVFWTTPKSVFSWIWNNIFCLGLCKSSEVKDEKKDQKVVFFILIYCFDVS